MTHFHLETQYPQGNLLTGASVPEAQMGLETQECIKLALTIRL